VLVIMREALVFCRREAACGSELVFDLGNVKPARTVEESLQNATHSSAKRGVRQQKTSFHTRVKVHHLEHHCLHFFFALEIFFSHWKYIFSHWNMRIILSTIHVFGMGLVRHFPESKRLKKRKEYAQITTLRSRETTFCRNERLFPLLTY